MTETTIARPRRTDRLAEAYFAAVNNAAEEFLTDGSITDDTAQSVETLAAAMLASNAVGINARLTKIATALDTAEVEGIE